MEDKMNILYLHQYFIPLDGIGGTRSYEFARRLVKAGHRVTMITSSAGFPPHYRLDKAVNLLELEGIQLKVLQVSYSNHFSYLMRIKAFLSFAIKSIIKTVQEDSVDLIFATSTPLTIALPGIIGKIRHKCPLVFEVRDLWPELPIAVGALKNPLLIRMAKLLEKKAYQHSARVVALSPGMAQGVAAAGFPPEHIAIIPNCCDVDLFRVDTSAGEKFLLAHPYLRGGDIVTYCGTLGLINGVDYLARIAAEMRTRNPKIQFVIMGSGSRKEAVIAEAQRCGVWQNNLWVLPHMTKNEIPDLLSATTLATSLFVDIPQMWNNSANKFFDALAAARPVAINYQGWQADFLESSGAGIVMPADDAGQAAWAIDEFLRDKKKYNRARQAAAYAADTIFNRDFLADRLVALLEETVHGGDSRTPSRVRNG